MTRVLEWLKDHWFAGLLVACAFLAVVVVALRRRRLQGTWLPLLGLAGYVALAGVGGMVLGWGPALLVTLGAAVVFAALVVVLLLTGAWWWRVAAAVGGVLAFGLGGMACPGGQEGLREVSRNLRGLEFLSPWWLLLLLLIPVLVWFSWRSLAGLGPVRSKVALGLRCLLVLALALALAEPRVRQQSENMTVLFLVDRSLSVPEDLELNDQGKPATGIDRRWERVKRFIKDAVEKRPAAHQHDQAGLIVFGRRPRLALPPAAVPHFNFNDEDVAVENNYTDIAAAIKLALASFPESTGKRIVLISDGNQNLGDAEEQARLARQNGVQIDVLPLAAGRHNDTEVLVQSIEAPGHVERGSQLPIRVLVRSYNPQPVVGTLFVRQGHGGPNVDDSPRTVLLQKGLNVFTFKQPLTEEQRSYTYEAEFQPEGIARVTVGDDGKQKVELISKGLPGDRAQNNVAMTHVVARGHRRILLIESKEGEHAFLVQQVEKAGKSKFQVESKPVEKLPPDKGALAAMLSEYDSVILANVAASDVAEGNVGGDNLAGVITQAQQEVIRSNTHDQGCGLLMIGGPNSFGAGGWAGTPVEKALPVDCDIKSLEVTGKGGLVLIMHASEMANGNSWQKEIAKLAIKKLTANDEVGVVHFDFTTGTARWHIKLDPIEDEAKGRTRQGLLNMVDNLTPGDMPDFQPAIKMSFDELVRPERGLATKHIILISDGDPAPPNPNTLGAMRAARVTCTTVGVATHGAPQDQALAAIAQQTKGRFYNVKSPNALPEIYTKETRLVSQSYLYEPKGGFMPHVLFRDGPTAGLPDPVPKLYGFVRTTAKANPLVETSILSPPLAGGQEFPILSYWHYGLGKAVAFTSDARTQQQGLQGWDRDWAGSPMYDKFWEQVIEWSLRPVESRRLSMVSEYRDGKVIVTVEARDDDGKPVVLPRLVGKVTTPGKDVDEKGLVFEQKNVGVYVAEFKAEEAGSYFVTAGPTRQAKLIKDGKEVVFEEMYDRTAGGVTIPYSPEFADVETNTTLLEKLRGETNGESYVDDEKELESPAALERVFREGPPNFRSLQPVWYWLVALAAVALFFDVAVRRIAVDPLEVTAVAQTWWDRMRGRHTAAPRAAEFFDRLKSRKAEVGEALQKSAKGARRFEGEGGPVVAPPPGAEAAPAPSDRPRPAARPAAPGGVGPQAEKQPEDYASRLMKAKRKAMEERDKKKDE